MKSIKGSGGVKSKVKPRGPSLSTARSEEADEQCEPASLNCLSRYEMPQLALDVALESLFRRAIYESQLRDQTQDMWETDRIHGRTYRHPTSTKLSFSLLGNVRGR